MKRMAYMNVESFWFDSETAKRLTSVSRVKKINRTSSIDNISNTIGKPFMPSMSHTESFEEF